ncbi:MAG: carboxypeptidase-like regulatory domain-containing protein [Gemmatimonadaceae bacterium]|nr:carboxypeptidase-like regulatory domain-containing protein [Gemmatimonadaceae bacterium]
MQRTSIVRAVASLSLLMAPPLLGQTGVLYGKVLDKSTGQPIVAASVGFVGGAERFMTDSLGRFRMPPVSVGGGDLEARRIGFHPRALPVRVIADSQLFVEFRLDVAPKPLETVVVKGITRKVEPFLEEPFLRASQSWGSFLFGEDLKNSPSFDLKGAMVGLPGLWVNDRNVSFMRCNNLGGKGVVQQPHYYIDGLRFRTTEFNDVARLVALRDVALVEVYNGTARIPPVFLAQPQSPCAVVAIWTRRSTE